MTRRNMILPDLKTTDIRGKRVFLRMDLDAPLKEIRDKGEEIKMEVVDDTRLVVGIPTLKYLLENEAKVVIGGHVRRPEEYDPKLSVRPVAEWICDKFKVQSLKFKVEEADLDGFKGFRLSESLFVLENLRFYKEEKVNDEEFARKLANFADIYINDAFASSHRSHASIVGIPKFLPHFAGFHLKKEIDVLSSIFEDPKRPLIVIVGGEKIETKLPLVSKMCHVADNILVGGKIAQEIQKNDGLTASNAVLEKEKGIRCAFLIADMNKEGTDITEKSVDDFIKVINMAKTIVWNGPVGKISSKFKIQSSKFAQGDSEYGSWRLAEAIANSGVYTVVGGGDTLEFLKSLGLLNKFSFFSTGGGAMLSFLSGEKLPGIEALTM